MKYCKICKIQIVKIPKWSYKQFESMVVCSIKCRNLWHRNYRPTKEILEKQSKSHIGKSHPWNKGENNNFWRGGKTPKILALRMSLKYKIWRRAVFERDNYKCVICGYKGNKLNADHIKPFCDYPELRFVIDNGRTLCVSCHKTTDTFGRKAIKDAKFFHQPI